MRKFRSSYLLSLSPSSSPSIDQTQSVTISATLSNDRRLEGVSWTLIGPGSLSGGTSPGSLPGGMAASITYNSPTGNLTSAQQATVIATSVADKTKTASLKITVNPYPQFVPLQTLANGSVRFGHRRSGQRICSARKRGRHIYPANGSPLHLPSPPYDDFPSPLSGPALAVGDFNRSGHAGLAVDLFENLAADILFGHGDGTFSFADTLARIDGQPTMSLTAADFNGDGDLDLAAANTISGLTPVALLGYGHGAFNSVSQSVEISAISSAAGDFNGDGMLDLLLGGSGISEAGNGGNSSLLLGHGDGTFTPGPSVATDGFVAVGDFNGDGKLDLAFTDPQANTVTILSR